MTADDVDQLAEMGITTEAAPMRSAFPTERLLQAIADGAVVAPDLRSYHGEHLTVYIDGRAMDEPESRALVELLTHDLAGWSGPEIYLTPRGAGLLRRWAKYQPMRRRNDR